MKHSFPLFLVVFSTTLLAWFVKLVSHLSFQFFREMTVHSRQMRLAQTLSCDYRNLALMTLQSISPWIFMYYNLADYWYNLSSPILRQTPFIKVYIENVYIFVQDPCYNKIEDTTLWIPESIVDDRSFNAKHQIHCYKFKITYLLNAVFIHYIESRSLLQSDKVASPMTSTVVQNHL